VRAVPWLLLAPALATFAVFAAAFVMFAEISFVPFVPGSTVQSGPATLDNYRRVLSSSLVHDAAVTTIALASLMTGITAILGYPLAYVLARTPSALVRRGILFGLVVTFLSGGVTRAYAWLVLLGNRGLLNQLLAAVGLAPLQLVHNKIGVVTGVVHFLLPFFVLALLGTIKNIPVALEDVARNLGAGGWRVFVHVTLPLSLPGLITTCSLTFVGALSAFLFPELLGGGRTHMAATIIYQRIVTNYNVPEAAAMAALFLLLSLGVLGGLGLLQQRLARRYPLGTSHTP
jgi:putative spermidine/putrescine transport system permease protein